MDVLRVSSTSKSRALAGCITGVIRNNGRAELQAIGAAAENMALEAASRGIGSLWVGNVFFAYDELTEWIGKGEMILAMSFGYAEKEGYPLPRKKDADVIEIRD